MDTQPWITIVATIASPVLLLVLQRGLSWRSDQARADVDEATADATTSAAWEKFSARLEADVDKLRKRIVDLEAEVGRLKDSLSEANTRVQIQASLLRSVIRWALLLRDELLKVDGHVPPMPPDVEAAITTLEP